MPWLWVILKPSLNLSTIGSSSMEAFAGLSGVMMLVIMLFIFRKPVKKATDVLPEAVEKVLVATVKGAEQLDSIVSTNCAESELDCRVRMKAVVERIKQEELPTVDEAYNFIMGK